MTSICDFVEGLAASIASATLYPAFSRVNRSTRRRLSLSSTSRISAIQSWIFQEAINHGSLIRGYRNLTS